MNVVNVAKLIRENAHTDTQRLWVSKEAISEWVSRIIDRIEDYIPLISEQVERENRKKITEDDIIKFFSKIGRDVI